MRTFIRRHRLLIASGAVGLAAFIASFTTMSSYVRDSQAVVAARDIEPYTKLEAKDLALVQVPQKAVGKGVCTSLEQVSGAYARSRLVAGQMVMAAHLIRGEEGVGFSWDLPSDTRGIFLPVPAERALGGKVKPGEEVDAIFVRKQGVPEPAATTTVTRLPIVDVVKDESSGEFLGVMVLALPADCEVLARNLETCAVYLSLVPKSAPATEPVMEVWPTR